MEYLCQYGNCDSHEVRVTVTRKGEGTQRFCCDMHAAASLLNLAQLRAVDGGKRAEIAIAKQPIIAMADQL